MSKHYDNWERLVAAVLRKEHDRQLALSHSRDNSSTSSSSCSCGRSCSSTSQPDHDHSLIRVLPERGDPLRVDYSDPTSLDHSDWKVMMPPPSNRNSITEEDRWLREEQRWLREERRWLREESRWNAERQAFFQEIHRLKLRIKELERLNSLQVLKEGGFRRINENRIADSGISTVPLVVGEEEEKEEVFVKEVISHPEKKEMVKKRATLRKGIEGDMLSVATFGEASQKLGFYSGEEDIKYYTFPRGTECAAILGAPEDGNMSADYLEGSFESLSLRLNKNEERKSTDPEKCVVSEQEVVTDVGVSQHRVFNRENQWEEYSRLPSGSKSKNYIQDYK